MKEWTREDIEKQLEAGGPAVIYFYTPLCGTCQLAGKMLEVAAMLFKEVPIGQANLNFVPEFSELLTVESVPCLVIFKDGKLQEKLYAFHSVPYLVEKITASLKH
ncbi:thiol reductase thioredoxin [Bacillus canaveralius]|uniref:Thiol reductase thioredoxin n=1 Tax=Bacillus canaveralius TaxID=1403243 RepID=A0A2N5GLY5_9BACI|nr:MULTISPECIES: thioredoxin family protein [Bacillus]PLR82878.1 thiol reductase thioredoxin [Bacillus canaveralius]PLR85248.1 thiol reductase thioredoxin [Bacillus sp. V33-4]PLR97117.1 thiol reductase thioredoxin [Bacillus canaveralius]RSK55484.1 thioredoxin [Bacillus canaveralius]